MEETAEAATNHTVFEGADDGTASVMRWINQTVHIRRGAKVTLVNNGVEPPHTVTFGVEQPNVFIPCGDPTHFTGQPLDSGIFLPGATFTVTFTK